MRFGRQRARDTSPRAGAPGSDGSASPSSAGAVPGTPASRAIAPAVAGASPERTLRSTPSAAKNATVSAAFGRSRSARTTRPSACTPSGNWRVRRCRRQRRDGLPQRQHAPPCARLLARPLRKLRLGGRESLRRAEHEPHVAEVERAPAPPRRERHLPDHRAPLGIGEAARRRSPAASKLRDGALARSSRARRRVLPRLHGRRQHQRRPPAASARSACLSCRYRRRPPRRATRPRSAAGQARRAGRS